MNESPLDTYKSALRTVIIQLFSIVNRFYSLVPAVQQALTTHHSLGKHLLGSYCVPTL